MSELLHHRSSLCNWGGPGRPQESANSGMKSYPPVASSGMVQHGTEAQPEFGKLNLSRNLPLQPPVVN